MCVSSLYFPSQTSSVLVISILAMFYPHTASRAPVRVQGVYEPASRWSVLRGSNPRLISHALVGRAPFFHAPTGHEMVAGDSIPGDGAGWLPFTRTPEGYRISPQIPLIVFDPAPLEDLHILFLKRLLPVMFLLPQDIPLHHSDA